MRSRVVKSFSIEKRFIPWLEKEPNQSEVVNTLLCRHYGEKQDE